MGVGRKFFKGGKLAETFFSFQEGKTLSLTIIIILIISITGLNHAQGRFQASPKSTQGKVWPYE